MNTFREIFDSVSREQLLDEIYQSTGNDVERALVSEKRTLHDFKALVSPAADKYIEQMAQISRKETLRRFGNVIQLYAPMYLSNECQNICTYCGFSLGNKIPRKTLRDDEIIREAESLRRHGFEHVLLVTGESHKVAVPYFLNALALLKPLFAQISMEVQPLETEEYGLLADAGVHSVLVYQESYNRNRYREFHPRGKKSNFYYRLECPERIGAAGLHKIGLGVLLGLDDWRVESYMLAMHQRWLEKKFWKTRFSVSFPRLRPFSGGDFQPETFTNRNLVQLITAYRLFNPELELSISTREPASFRDHLIPLGVNSASAGSKTNPGGYSVDETSLEQFEIHDERSPAEVVEAIRKSGYDAVWKDWDPVLSMSV